MYRKSLVLDTCALLWLASGDRKLGEQARQLLDTCSIAWVSPISAWEVALKASQKQLLLPEPPGEWFDEVVEQHGLSVAPLDVDLLIASASLPWHHRDPADRIVIATAMRQKAAVITADKRFAAYAVEVIA